LFNSGITGQAQGAKFNRTESNYVEISKILVKIE